MTNVPTFTSVFKVGLFGYDISCIYSLCADQEDFASLCSVLTGLGIDGWSMGVSAKMVDAESEFIGVAQHQLNAGDISIYPKISGADLPQY